MFAFENIHSGLRMKIVVGYYMWFFTCWAYSVMLHSVELSSLSHIEKVKAASAVFDFRMFVYMHMQTYTSVRSEAGNDLQPHLCPISLQFVEQGSCGTFFSPSAVSVSE